MIILSLGSLNFRILIVFSNKIAELLDEEGKLTPLERKFRKYVDRITYSIRKLIRDSLHDLM